MIHIAMYSQFKYTDYMSLKLLNINVSFIKLSNYIDQKFNVKTDILVT